jgi:hypothetical protein
MPLTGQSGLGISTYKIRTNGGKILPSKVQTSEFLKNSEVSVSWCADWKTRSWIWFWGCRGRWCWVCCIGKNENLSGNQEHWNVVSPKALYYCIFITRRQVVFVFAKLNDKCK